MSVGTVTMGDVVSVCEPVGRRRSVPPGVIQSLLDSTLPVFVSV